jgi:lipopolysaccharide export system permease protein
MPILIRYVLADLAKVFLVALAALTMMMLVVGLFREAAQQNLPLSAVLRLVPYILPDALRMTVPVTLLLASTTVFSRMSGANEVVAIKALGISPMVLLWPVLVLSFLLSLLTVWLNDMAVSWGRNGVQQVVLEAAEDIIYSVLQSQRHYSSSGFSINVKQVDSRRLQRITLTLQPRNNAPSVMISAEEAELRSDPVERRLKIALRNGTVDWGKASLQFDFYEVEIPLNEASKARSTGGSPSWMALREIPEEIARQEAEIQREEQTMAAAAAYQMLCGEFDEMTDGRWEGRRSARVEQWGRLYRLMTEPHRRWSAGFSCLCFVLVGAPMAIRLRNRDFLTSFFLCFLPILVVYYPLLAAGIDGAKNGSVPYYSVWAGNLLLVLWSAVLFRKVQRY